MADLSAVTSVCPTVSLTKRSLWLLMAFFTPDAPESHGRLGGEILQRNRKPRGTTSSLAMTSRTQNGGRVFTSGFLLSSSTRHKSLSTGSTSGHRRGRLYCPLLCFVDLSSSSFYGGCALSYRFNNNLQSHPNPKAHNVKRP